MVRGDYRILSLTALLIFGFLASCQKNDLKPGIPSFIEVTTLDLQTDYSIQGTDSQKITDVWVFVDDQSIGAFEISEHPAVIPILKEGTGTLRLEAGIKINGISATRIPNPFYKPIIIENFNFLPDSIIQVSGTTTYWETVTFVWMEDFEGVSISVDTTSKSKADMVLTPSGTDLTFEGSHSGRIILDEDHDLYEGASFEAFELPTDGTPVVLEMNYKTNSMFTVGIFAQTASQIIQDPLIYLNPKDEWNKIYINLTNKLWQTSDDVIDFKIFFGAILQSDATEAEILIDNIKLIYRKNY
jgi:hypothetical protein